LREGVARAAWAGEEGRGGGGEFAFSFLLLLFLFGGKIMDERWGGEKGDWLMGCLVLEVEDLEKLAPQLLLDF